MRRVNTFTVEPLQQRDRLLLFEVLDASAALWNELTYKRRQALFADQDIWQVDVDAYRVRYKGVLGSATAQQLIRKNDEAWRSFFALLEDGEDPSPPGYWKDDGERDLRTLIRNDQYTLMWGDRSRLEIPVGLGLKEKYGLGYHERLRLEARGNPRWTGKQGRLELVYDRDAETFRARQPVSEAVRSRDDSLATVSSDDDTMAALDIGANTLVAVTTSTGHQRRYQGQLQFDRFRATTERIASLQEFLPYGESSSRRIRRLYRQRARQVYHLQDALISNLVAWLSDIGVGAVFVGDLGGVLDTHWSAVVNEKTHQFWSHGRFRRRLREILEGEYGISVREVNEAGSSSTCPECGGMNVKRDGELLACHSCGFEGHADLAASENLLIDNVGSMARPAVSRENTTEKGHGDVPCLKWDDHRWRRRDHQSATNEEPVDRSTYSGKFVFGVDSGSA